MLPILPAANYGPEPFCFVQFCVGFQTQNTPDWGPNPGPQGVRGGTPPPQGPPHPRGPGGGGPALTHTPPWVSEGRIFFRVMPVNSPIFGGFLSGSLTRLGGLGDLLPPPLKKKA